MSMPRPNTSAGTAKMPPPAPVSPRMPPITRPSSPPVSITSRQQPCTSWRVHQAFPSARTHYFDHRVLLRHAAVLLDQAIAVPNHDARRTRESHGQHEKLIVPEGG